MKIFAAFLILIFGSTAAFADHHTDEGGGQGIQRIAPEIKRVAAFKGQVTAFLRNHILRPVPIAYVPGCQDQYS